MLGILRKPALTNIFLILYLSIFGGAIGLFAKLSFVAFSPLATIFFRILISSLFFILILTWQKKFKSVFKIIFTNWKQVLILSFFGVGAAMIIGFVGLRYTSAINYGLIYNLSSIFILIFSLFFLGEKLKKLDIFLILVAFVGADIIVTNGKFYFNVLEAHVLGDLLVLISAMGWALYSVLGAKFSRQNKEFDSLSINLGVFLFSLIVLTPIMFLSPSNGINFSTLNLKVILGILGLSVLSTAVLFFLWLKFVDKEGGIWATLVSLSENLTGVLLPIIFLGEKLTTSIVVGGILMILAISGKELFSLYHKKRSN